jgi:ElaB/YqjD/DUF883 family membrane-anchored ribosome-binding protein
MNSTTQNAGRDPEELEREASEIRADMNRTLDALERKFSPGQLLDRSLAYLREHGGDWTHGVGETVRRNPVPVLMTVAGITWLVASSILSRTREQSPLAEGEFEDEAELDDDDELEADDLDEATFGAAGFQDRVAATRERIRASRAAAANKISAAAQATRERTHRVQRRVGSLMDEQPLAFGAIAVAIGALIGAAIPTTEYENRTVGQMRDRALAKAKQMGERQYENLRSRLETHEEVQVSGQAH